MNRRDAETRSQSIELLTQCAWCRRVRLGFTKEGGAIYVVASPAPWVRVSHGACPDCFATLMKEAA